MIGQALGHYRILATLGAGGMGEVYRAADLKLGREVAIKVVPERFASEPERLARLEREARAVAALNHPNIVTIHSIEEDRGVHFLTLELVEGQTLDKLVPVGGLPMAKALEFALPLTEALAAAHGQGIVHRDLKPGNVMVTDDGRVKVLDFGLAKLIEDKPEPASDGDMSQAPTRTASLTGAGMVLGTIPYLSPELLEGHEVDHRADIFALGVLLYELLTGLRPFQGKSGPAMVSAILRDTPRPVSEVNPTVPGKLARVISRCLEKDPQRRYQTSLEVVDELRGVKEGIESGSVSAARWPSPRRSWAWIGAALVGLLAVGLVAFVLTQRPSRSAPVPAQEPFDATQWVIAVLPSRTAFAEDPDLIAVNQGLALTMTAKLALLSPSHALQVIPAGMLAEAEIDSLEEARQELGVTLGVSFDTHRLGDSVRVNAQLVDVTNRRQVSAATIDGDSDNLLALEEAVTSRVLGLLRVELQPTEKTLLAEGTSDSRAYNSYLRARGHLLDYHDATRVETAARLFEEALAVDPEYAEAHAGLGEALWHQYLITNNMSWVEAALGQCSKAVELDPLQAEGHICLGTVYNGTGRFEEAVGELTVAKSLDPSQDRVFKGLADAFLAMGNLELAERTYREAVAVRPHYWAPHNWLGIFYLGQGSVEESLGSFSEVVRLAPDSYLGYSNLGAAHYYAGKLDRARENFERALAIKPDDDLALSNLGTMSFFEGRYEQATDLFQRAVAINPSDCFNWGQLADAYQWSPGARDKAAEAYRRAVSLCEDQLSVNPKSVMVLIDIAYYHAMLSSRAEALQALERALELLPSDIDVQHRAAQVHEALGQRKQALRFLEDAIGNGYPRGEIEADPLFAQLTDTPEFRRIVDAVPR